MWLINTDTLTLEEVTDPFSYSYAILSHTWDSDEITFQNIWSSERRGVERKIGYSKLAKTCEIARQRGLQYAWVDSCCIDKSSSAELSEAINSMFAWYQHSKVCFAFLSDLSPLDTNGTISTTSFPYSEEAFRRCRWFTRGWTLQELIAPNIIEFYNSEWTQVSRKADCLDILSKITGISYLVLQDSSNLRHTPVAVKMSWAASRKTKRIEDRAYSLLGVFNINMPMIYGEGHKAFRRLQEEIARETNDLSLFAWRVPHPTESESQMFRGLFARSPSEFSSCATITKSVIRHDTQQEFSLTNKGVRIQTKLYKHAENAHVMSLGLRLASGTPVCVSLTRTTDGFVRNEPWSLEYGQAVKGPDTVRDMFTIHIRKDVTPQEDSDIRRQMHRSFRIAFELPASLKLEHVVPDPDYLWDSVHSTLLSNDPSKSSAAKLNITISGTDGNFSENFYLALIVGWMRSTGKPFAVLYGATESADSVRGSVRHVLPKDFPDLVGDDVDWGNSQQDVFESALSTIFSDSRFQATEVHFINAKTMVLHLSVRKRSAYVARFHAKMETCCNDPDVITYHVSLSGSLSRVEGHKAVSDAYSQVPATSSDLEG
ncbi:HET domain-containing protein [Colletotrichum kahawae]|uniref:HET domain-containing protein n=1 Tax=Colletotrichum kahawae TaxID=34407 RepID=A0AAD9YKQ3_COLKA|nr:HET domain-containing protein [Colletotrichum kahawae]